MEREKFIQEARKTVHQILASKENDIMNVVHQAWAEGKRNAEVADGQWVSCPNCGARMDGEWE